MGMNLLSMLRRGHPSQWQGYAESVPPQVSPTPLATPWWLMRQAGRYLPEYRAVRQTAGSFMALALNPHLAEAVTLQPLARFGMRGAILFSDILMVPYGLGRNVTFTAGEGPEVAPVNTLATAQALTWQPARIAPVLATVRGLRQQLEAHYPATTLIGFAGGPWTVGLYCCPGEHTKGDGWGQQVQWLTAHPDIAQTLQEKLLAATTQYLVAQAHAGAAVLQIFESWAQSAVDFEAQVARPLQQLVQNVRAQAPGVPIILFPRVGADLAAFVHVVKTCQPDGVGIGHELDLTAVMAALAAAGCYPTLQGNYDPSRLATLPPAQITAEVSSMVRLGQTWPGGYIANLGHGILPHTPIDNVVAFAAGVNAVNTP